MIKHTLLKYLEFIVHIYYICFHKMFGSVSTSCCVLPTVLSTTCEGAVFSCQIATGWQSPVIYLNILTRNVWNSCFLPFYHLSGE